MKTLSLAGSWNLSGGGKTGTASIPGDFHSALLKEGLIPDPYYAQNESAVQWVGRTEWTIERSFDFFQKPEEKTYLVLTDADTFFTVWINGKNAGTGNNMFRRYRFDVTDKLVDGCNRIRIVFESAEKHAVEEGKKLPYPIPYSTYPVYSPHRNLVRKVQCHAGWDWGPCLMVCGIYGCIELDSTSEGWFENVTVSYSHNATAPGKTDIWNVMVQAEYTALRASEQSVTFSINGGTLRIAKTRSFHTEQGTCLFQDTLVVKEPEIWRTADELRESGRMENTLYTLTVRTTDTTGNSDTEICKKIAFRTLNVIAEDDEPKPGTKPGRAMYIRLNGRKIFAKGADWIPCDALPSRQTDDRYKQLLQAAADSHMNIIRIWGGGQYEKDIFYDLCDRLGLMIWHDCMFACSLYPSTPEFLESVSKELDYQIPRLQTHPSIALWCGNNEDIGAINWYEESRKNRDRYIIDYDRLNSGVVEKAIKKWDPDRSWWPSSPCAGPDDFSDNWHNDNMGDMHYWNVWHEKSSFDAYLSITPRFVSEFGYESFPSIEGVSSYAPQEEYNLTSPVLEYHQRSAGGNSTILENFSRYFRFPVSFDHMLYLSQVQQALAIKTAVEYWRTLRPHCMGTIFWQLNDVWPVASWSSIEYSGKWKLLQYAAKEFYAPVLLSLYSKKEKLIAAVCNDTVHTLNVTVRIHIFHFDGTEVGQPAVLTGPVQSDSVCRMWEKDVTGLGEKPEKCFIFAELTAYTSDRDRTYTAENTLFPALYKQCAIEKPEISIGVEPVSTKKTDSGSFRIVLESSKPAFFTSLDCTGIAGRFDRNMITLLPGRKTVIKFTAEKESESVQVIRKALKITSLRTTY